MKRLWLTTILGLLLAASASGVAGSTNVSLRITTGSASRQSNIVHLPVGDVPSNYVSFACTAVVDNQAGGPLTIMSAFHSSFDGLHLMVMDTSGKQLARQSYLYHQSPYSPTKRPFTLSPGRTTKDLRFPIGGIPTTTKTVSLRLEGTLPGSAYSGSLTSNVVSVKIDE
jgi:hypothetical protein